MLPCNYYVKCHSTAVKSAIRIKSTRVRLFLLFTVLECLYSWTKIYSLTKILYSASSMAGFWMDPLGSSLFKLLSVNVCCGIKPQICTTKLAIISFNIKKKQIMRQVLCVSNVYVYWNVYVILLWNNNPVKVWFVLFLDTFFSSFLISMLCPSILNTRGLRHVQLIQSYNNENVKNKHTFIHILILISTYCALLTIVKINPVRGIYITTEMVKKLR